MSELNLDLTTQEGYSKAMEIFDEFGWLYSPLPWVVHKLLGKFNNMKPTIEMQAEAASKLIAEGKEQGLKKMKIKLSKNTGIDVGIPIEGVPIKAKIGADETMEIEVEY